MKRKRSLLLPAAAILLCVSALPTDHRQHLFEQGNQYFQTGEYGQAIQKYQEVLDLGYASADLYYNLGNSFFKAGENSRAILNYERALRLHPQDEDIQFNLQIANLYVTDNIPELPELFYKKYFRRFRELFNIRTLTLVTLGLYFLFMGSAILWLLSRSMRPRRIFKLAFFVSLVLLAAFSFTWLSQIHSLQNHIMAIVMSPQVDVRSSPTAEGTEIFTIHEGLKVTVIDIRDEWREIRLSDGKEGWLSAGDIEVI